MNDTQIADRDKVRAQELHQKILIHAQLVAQNLWEMCSSLKEMRDSKYFYNLGYMHFEEYCRESLGMTRQQAHKYISIVDNLKPDFVNSSLQIGVTKLALLASISDGEREEIMQQTDVESVTVRELKEQIKGLQAEKERLETDLSESSEVQETLENSLEVTQRQHSEYVKNVEYTKQQLALKNQQLAAELEDLKNNPLPEDKYRIAAKKHDKDMMEFREQADVDWHDERQQRWDVREECDECRKKEQDITRETERQLREAKDKPPAVIEVNATVSEFKAYFEIARESLYQMMKLAAFAAEPEPLYNDMEDLFDTFIELIKEQREGNENGAAV